MKEKNEVKKKKSHRLLKALIAIIVVAGVGVGIYFAISSSGILSKKAPVYKIEIFNGESFANSQQIKENNEIDLSTLHIDGYTIDGLYDNPQFEGEKLTGKIKITKDTKIYAKTTIESYNIQFFVDSQMLETKTVQYNQSVTFAAEDIPEGHYFDGWKVNDKLYPSVFVVEDLGENGDTINLIAELKIEKYKLNFSANGGTTPQQMTVNYGDEIALPQTSKIGYEFQNWKKGEQTYSETYLVPDLGNNNQEVTFIAQWEIKKYTVQYKVGENLFKTENYQYGQNLPQYVLTNNIPEGHYFNGWTLNGENLKSTASVGDWGDNGATIIIQAELPIESYNINFYKDSTATLSKTSIIVKYGETVTLPLPSKKGYTFNNWTYEEQVCQSIYTVPDLGNNNKTIVFYPDWQAKEYTLSFNYGDKSPTNSPAQSIKVKFDQDITSLLPAPTFEEPFILNDWYIDENLTKNAPKTYTIDGNSIYYAKVTQTTSSLAFGDGTKENPFRLYNAEQFEEFINRSQDNRMDNPYCDLDDAHLYFKLMNDITVLPNNHIGTSHQIMVKLDGNNKTLTYSTNVFYAFEGTISNLKIKPIYNSSNTSATSINTFISSLQRGGVLENITIVEDNYKINFYESNNHQYKAAILVYYNYGSIKSCNNYGNFTITDRNNSINDKFAIFCSTNEYIIDGCNNYGNITAEGMTASVFAAQNENIIRNCKSECNITADIVNIVSGVNYGTPMIENVELKGNVTARKTATLFGKYDFNSAKTAIIKNCKYSSSLNSLGLLYLEGYINNSSKTITKPEEYKPYFSNEQQKNWSTITQI